MIGVTGDSKFFILDSASLSVRSELLMEYPCFIRFSKSGRYVALGSWKKSFVVPIDHLEGFADELKHSTAKRR
jgi:hypothetical protein